ncbi:UMP-CMP kinase-like [Homalodisca vitripennis]|uniref:UMP-CMP kinase n=1 Tax=Homalodisca liturata TaxID=320908 RepID=A0A1B6J0B0_9HEMI|nr:UMP-CMP kinase-like [Homalodisca vitripennis]KAG8336772.1 cytidine monophosphate (UMP-CMP) kinase 1, cytosolic [Homalodisca vitripennis]
MRQNFVLQFCKQIFKMGDVFKPKVVFVLGGPGAGKGTQCANIVKEFGFMHISAGDLLREERSKPGTKYGELIDEHIRNGIIVPVEITCKLIEIAMQNSGKEKFLIDGFPRNENNLEGWNKVMAEKVELLFVLFFDCSQDICVQRCLKRGAQGSGRSDDNEESLKKRLQTFVNDSMPIIEHFKERNLVHRIDADQEPNEVFEDVKAIFQNIP